MIASMLVGPKQVEMLEVPTPDIVDGQVLLQMQSAAICGSDIGNYRHGALARADRDILPGCTGHEFVGKVVRTRADRFTEGQRVLAMPPLGNGFAQYLAVPASCCIPVPDGLSADIAIQAQQLGTVIHALRPVGSLLDKSVAIVGMGPAGRHFLAMALNMGARSVVGFEHRERRLRTAQTAGADLVVNPLAPGALQEARSALGNGPDVVIDAAGGQSGIDLSYQLARLQSVVLRFGLPHGATTLDHNAAIRKEVTTYHAVGAQAEPELACFRLAMRLVQGGQVDVARLVSHHLTLDRLPEGLELAADRQGDAIKVVIDPA